MLTLEDFPIDILSFELRFDNAYLLWDRIGTFWTQMQVAIPDLKLQAVQPNQQVLENADLQLTMELGLCRINARGPKALAMIISHGQEMYTKACNLLNIDTFTRVGYRNVRMRVFQEKAAALSEMSAYAPKMYGNALGDGAEQVGYTVNSRIENETSGLLASMRVEPREVNIKIPWEVSAHLQDFKKKILLCIWTLIITP